MLHPHAHLIPSKSDFSLETVKAFVNSAQNYKKGVLLVSDGQVYEFRLADRNSDFSLISTVISEKSNTYAYNVSIKFSKTGIEKTNCPCVAGSSHVHALCKHVAAALLACIVIRDHFNDQKFPQWFKTKSRMRLWNPEAYGHAEFFGDWNMVNVVKKYSTTTPEQLSSSKLVVLSKPVEKAKKLKTYCYCEGNNDKMAMLECPLCQRWFHFTCVRNTHKDDSIVENDRNSHKNFICKGCELRKANARKKIKTNL